MTFEPTDEQVEALARDLHDRAATEGRMYLLWDDRECPYAGVDWKVVWREDARKMLALPAMQGILRQVRLDTWDDAIDHVDSFLDNFSTE